MGLYDPTNLPSIVKHS